jgi:hypothetical protein
MRKSLALAAAVMLVGCASLRSEPLPAVGPPEYARVAAKRPLDIRAGETRGERAAWALLSLDPIVIAAAVLAVEDEHGRSQLSEYDLNLVQGGIATVRSRYVVEIGQCIMMRRGTQSDYVIVVAQDEARCGEALAADSPGS